MGTPGRGCFVVACLLFAAPLPAADDDEVRVGSAEELRDALGKAKPGARILIEPGTYELGLHLSRLRGELGRPIVVGAVDPDRPPILRGKSNCLHLSDPAYLELRDLVLEGGRANGLNIDDGGTFETPARHITLRNIRVRDVGSDGNQDGIKLSGVDEFRIEACSVERWGRGGSGIDMVGCHDGVIEGCLFRDRREGGASNAVQAKGGSRHVIVRRCRFEGGIQRGVNVGGSTGLRFFRPRPEGYEAKDIVVEGCTFVGIVAPVAFVGVDGAVVRFNTIVRPRAWFLRILQETRGAEFVPSRGGVFSDNLVVYRSEEIRSPVNVGPGTAPETFVFRRNFWYCLDAPGRSRPRLPTPEIDGAGGVDPLLRGPDDGDFRLKEGSPAAGYGAGALPREDRARRPKRAPEPERP